MALESSLESFTFVNAGLPLHDAHRGRSPLILLVTDHGLLTTLSARTLFSSFAQKLQLQLARKFISLVLGDVLILYYRVIKEFTVHSRAWISDDSQHHGILVLTVYMDKMKKGKSHQDIRMWSEELRSR